MNRIPFKVRRDWLRGGLYACTCAGCKFGFYVCNALFLPRKIFQKIHINNQTQKLTQAQTQTDTHTHTQTVCWLIH